MSELTTTNNQTQAAMLAAPQVYAAINAVQGEIVKVGIGKNNTTTGGARFKFRGIDDLYNALSPIMARCGLVVMPRFTDRTVIERKSSNGSALFYTSITGHFDFIAVADGSKHTVITVGEAMDSGDKGTNKAMAIAHKYAMLQVFAIPTEGDNDPDGYTQEQQPYQGASQPHQQQQNNTNNQTRVVNAQRMNPPALERIPPPPQDWICFTKEDGKCYDQRGLRLFDSSQFSTVVSSIQRGDFTKAFFDDPNKFNYSNEQLAFLRGL